MPCTLTPLHSSQSYNGNAARIALRSQTKLAPPPTTDSTMPRALTLALVAAIAVVALADIPPMTSDGFYRGEREDGGRKKARRRICVCWPRVASAAPWPPFLNPSTRAGRAHRDLRLLWTIWGARPTHGTANARISLKPGRTSKRRVPHPHTIIFRPRHLLRRPQRLYRLLQNAGRRLLWRLPVWVVRLL
jgi:hypothetical protein